MGSYATKSFFKKRLREWAERGIEYFEVNPAPDCCPICEARANKKISAATATMDEFPPFHPECRCAISPLDENKEAGFLNELRARYESGELPMKRCPHCTEWVEGNAERCSRCGKEITAVNQN
jgi:hypothetical protein